MALGFSNGVLPTLKPLLNGGAFDGAEADVQAIISDLFAANLAADFFDANVLANPQLGSIALVRKALDGLGVSVINQLLDDTQIRLIHKSWAWTHRQKRGFFMLRTLLQIIYKEGYAIEPYWHPKATADNYPNDAFLLSENPDVDIGAAFLTSRVLVTIPLDGQPYLEILRKIALSIVPARTVVLFRSSSPEPLLIYGYGAATVAPDLLVAQSGAATDDFTLFYIGEGADG